MAPGAPLTGAFQVKPSSLELKTRRPAPVKLRVEKYVLPKVLSRASTGSPASPFGLVGRVPPSVQVAPISVDREKPVNLLEPGRKEPESLNPAITFIPD